MLRGHSLSTVFLDDSCDPAMTSIEIPKLDPAEPVVFAQDPIALSCASYRQAVATKLAIRFRDLNQYLTATCPEDHQMAKSLRQYYCNKIAVKTLTGTRPVTKFYHDLYELLLGKTVLQQRHMGMIHRLPYFYVEDLAREELRTQIQSVTVAQDWPTNSLNQIIIDKSTRTLRPIMTIFRSRKGRELHEYWFRDELNQPVLWTVLHGNPLHSVLKSLFERNSITIEAFFYTGQVLGQDFYHYYVTEVAVKEIA
jgi:hypothetical protein